MMRNIIVLERQALGVYRGPLYPELHDKGAELTRYAGAWVAAHFIQGDPIRPTGENFLIDPRQAWLLFHESDFDIIEGKLAPNVSGFDVASPKDGAIVEFVDTLKELARLITQRSLGSSDPFSPYRPPEKPFSYTDCVWPECDCGDTDMCRRNIEKPDAYLRRNLEAQAAFKRADASIAVQPHQYFAAGMYVAVIASCWFILGILIGWLGTYKWPWW
jgi:hypothetical protein